MNVKTHKNIDDVESKIGNTLVSMNCPCCHQHYVRIQFRMRINRKNHQEKEIVYFIICEECGFVELTMSNLIVEINFKQDDINRLCSALEEEHKLEKKMLECPFTKNK
jgi:C4-type Zn-finger protein